MSVKKERKDRKEAGIAAKRHKKHKEGTKRWNNLVRRSEGRCIPRCSSPVYRRLETFLGMTFGKTRRPGEGRVVNRFGVKA
jgi:hypothetical protein